MSLAVSLIPPKPATLAKYGLSLPEWLDLAEAQGGACAICKQPPKTGRLVIDHFHVKGWKKMPPEERKRWVRGLLCWRDNVQTVGRGATVDRLLSGAQYLASFEQRRPRA